MIFFNQRTIICHSTETDILKMHNDIVCGLDCGQCTAVLTSMGLPAAFDTVDHTIFTNRLHNIFGVQGKVLEFSKLYLGNRSCRYPSTIIYPHRIVSLWCTTRVSVMLRMYTIYTKPSSAIIDQHNMMYHSYAGDTQIYLHNDNSDTPAQNAVLRLQNYI